MNEPTTDQPTGPIAHPSTRDVVRISGPDAESYLQGQISQDVDALAVNTSTWTFVLAPAGKVDAWARVTKTAADTFVLDTDAGAGYALEARLRKFLLRTDADVERLEWPVVAVRGAGAPRGELPDEVLRLPVAGPGVEGYDLLGPGATVPDGVELVDEDGWTAWRIEHGIPVVGAEITEATIPAEVGQWIIDASVSFTKGCFVGQELTARIDSRGGNVPRRLRALVLDEPVAKGATVDAPGPTPTVTSAATSARHGPVALAYCGRAVEPGTTVEVDGVRGVVHELPLG